MMSSMDLVSQSLPRHRCPCLEGQWDLVSRLITTINHLVTLVLPISI